MNDRWCKNYTLRESDCSEDIELLSLSFRPHYLPREFGQIFVTLVHIHLRANARVAADTIYDTMCRLENTALDTPKLILWDFNGCTVKHVLPHFHQYIHCPTRGERTLDLCFGNIKEAYRGYPKPPLGDSDHNAVHLVSLYKQRLKTSNPELRTIQIWNNALTVQHGTLSLTITLIWIKSIWW